MRIFILFCLMGLWSCSDSNDTSSQTLEDVYNLPLFQECRKLTIESQKFIIRNDINHQEIFKLLQNGPDFICNNLNKLETEKYNDNIIMMNYLRNTCRMTEVMVEIKMNYPWVMDLKKEDRFKLMFPKFQDADQLIISKIKGQ